MPRGVQLRDLLHDHVQQRRIDAGAGLVEQDQLRLGHQHAGEFQQLALAARQHAGRLVAPARSGRRSPASASRASRLRVPRRRTAPGLEPVGPEALAASGPAAPASRSRAPSSRGRGAGSGRCAPRPRREDLRRGRSPSMRAPSQRERAAIGRAGSPASRLNSVVLPAPFGPDQPGDGRRARSVKDTPSTARWPAEAPCAILRPPAAALSPGLAGGKAVRPALRRASRCSLWLGTAQAARPEIARMTGDRRSRPMTASSSTTSGSRSWRRRARRICVRRQARRSLRTARRDAAPAARPGLLDLFARRGAAAAGGQAARRPIPTTG